jgi:hypothetical protein
VLAIRCSCRREPFKTPFPRFDQEERPSVTRPAARHITNIAIALTAGAAGAPFARALFDLPGASIAVFLTAATVLALLSAADRAAS